MKTLITIIHIMQIKQKKLLIKIKTKLNLIKKKKEEKYLKKNQEKKLSLNYFYKII